ALGYGWMMEADSYAPLANTWRLWDLAKPLVKGIILPNGEKQGAVVYEVEHDPNWSVIAPDHVTWENAVPDSVTPVTRQYGCGGAANHTLGVRSHEVECFLFDPSATPEDEQTLVVAPTMTDMDAPGGRDDYSKYPKGNLDPTGHYFFWLSNLGGDRLDAFMVEIPYQKLTHR
ncbi:MAG TPA: hypothetical protein VFX38_03990, partial [Gammaproteobacteria bacterium]|nr:hypothetical protein [Gammaproteobacteria bacterium]